VSPRNLRLCCVATTQLSSAPISRVRAADIKEDSLLDLDKAIGIQDQTMSVQAARGCLMLNAKELIASLQSSLNSPLESNHTSGRNADQIGNTSKSNLNPRVDTNGTNTKSSTDKTQVPSGGVWGGMEGGGVGSNLQQFVLIGELDTSLCREIGSDGVKWDRMRWDGIG
jgi:hypothetical protein